MNISQWKIGDRTFFSLEVDDRLLLLVTGPHAAVQEWAGLLSLASQPGESLEQLHVFCLAHVLRRPVIVYG